MLWTALIYLGGVFAATATLATPWGIGAAGLGALTGVFAASRLPQGRQLRLTGVLLVALLSIGVGLSERLIREISLPLPAQDLLKIAEVMFFGALTFGGVFAARALRRRWAVMALLEVAALSLSVVYPFINHRQRMIHKPQFLSDWAWSRGLDPHVVLQNLGLVAGILALALLMRRAGWRKQLVALLLLIGLAFGVRAFHEDLHLEPEIHTGGLDLTSQERDDEGGKGGKGGEGDKDSEGGKGGEGAKGDKNGKGGEGDKDGEGDKNGKGGEGDKNNRQGGEQNQTPRPVAVAIFHQDYEPEGGLLYFRQQVLSRYDGHHLVADTSGGFDQDVITEFPRQETLSAVEPLEAAFAVEVPTTMYLLVDHPQPPALSQAVALTPRENPDPKHFVAAYEVTSRALSMSYRRLLGHRSVPDDWGEAERAHYLATPDDPRYEQLGDEILRDIDPRFMDEDIVKALHIKRWLEKNGFYTRTERHVDADDPAASFLFGSLRGYCVHFAHAAAHLLRSQGIAARVALGYAEDLSSHGGGSSVLIMADRAHAWPEIHIAGVGWITFDIYPERSDERPQRIVHVSLEKLMGELARKDPTGGMAADPESAWAIPWVTLARWSLIAALALLLLAYLIKAWRRLIGGRSARHRWVFAAALDAFSDVGLRRRHGESRERHAARLAAIAPSFEALTYAHLRCALRGDAPEAPLRDLARAVARERRAALPLWRRLLGLLNPLGWALTR